MITYNLMDQVSLGWLRSTMMFQLRVEEQESLSNEPQAECRFSLVLSRLMHILDRGVGDASQGLLRCSARMRVCPGGDTSQEWRLGLSWGVVARVGLSWIKGLGCGPFEWAWGGWGGDAGLPLITNSVLFPRGPWGCTEQMLPQNNCPKGRGSSGVSLDEASQVPCRGWSGGWGMP